MSTYFTLPSFARAKKNKEDLEKTNPQDPVLKDEDEKFLENITSPGEPASEAKDVPPTEITDSGEEKEIPAEEAQADGAGDQLAVPETKPDQSDEKKVEETTERKDEAPEASADDPPEVTPDDDDPAKSASSPAKKKKSKGIELPSQEEAEAATRGFDAQAAAARQQGQDGTKRTWASYLPSVGSTAKRDGSQPNKSETTAKDGRTWAAYASSYVPSSLPSMPSWARSRDAKVEPVYNEDGSVNEEATKEKQEREVSVLLDNLHLSNINNRVFSFSDESRKFYERFTLVLKDVINGAPSAYDDMEKLMKDAGPTLEKQFNSMPPFVQTLVKALPAKLGTTLGPELMAAASEKPGHDGKARMEAASKQANKGGDPSIQPADDKEGDAQQKKKQKKTIPGLKGLVGEQGMAATILRNIVTFLQTRFPFLMTTTNVVMSLAVFILMFVFYYCWKRGRETRLALEAAPGEEKAEGEEADEIEVSDSDEDEEEAKGDGEDAAAATEETADQPAEPTSEKSEPSGKDSGPTGEEKAAVLNKSESAQAPSSAQEGQDAASGTEKA